jgi:hypothetical protein
MRRYWLWAALLLSLGVNIGIVATLGISRLSSSPGWQRGGPPPAPPVDRLADHLGLEGPTRERFVGIQRRFFSTLGEQRQHLEELRTGLRREMMAESPDRQRLDELLHELGDAYAGLDRALVENVLASLEVLDPEQREIYFGFLRRIHARALGERPVGRPGDRPRHRRPRP